MLDEVNNVGAAGPDPGSSAAELAALTPHQRRLFELVADHPGGLTVAELAALLSAHPNTIRGHLETLTARGLVRSSLRASPGRGRPSNVYQSTTAPPQVPGAHLASLLRSVVGSLAGDDGAARALGRTWADVLIAEGKFDSHTVTPIAEFDMLFARMGCNPATSPGGMIELRTCPFAEKGRPLPTGVCALHQGAVEALAADIARHRPALGITGVELRPFDGQCCTVHIRTAEEER